MEERYGPIQVLEGLEAVRRRPAMYIGGTDGDGVLHLLFEVLGNAVDQALMGRCTEVEVTLEEDGSIAVIDDGPGISVDPTEGEPFVVQVLTQLSHRPTRDGHTTHVHLSSTGGLGMPVVSALSTRMVVEARGGGRFYRTVAERGRLTEAPTDIGPAGDVGTSVTFTPDPEIFRDAVIDFAFLRTRLHEIAALCPGLVIRFSDRRAYRFHAPLGTEALLSADRYHGRRIPERPLRAHIREGEAEAEVVLQWGGGRGIKSFVNLQETEEGGSHVRGLREAMEALAREVGAADPTATAFALADAVRGVVAVRHFAPKFGGPTRARLDLPEVVPVVRRCVEACLRAFAAEHPEEARELVDAVFDTDGEARDWLWFARDR